MELQFSSTRIVAPNRVWCKGRGKPSTTKDTKVHEEYLGTLLR